MNLIKVHLFFNMTYPKDYFHFNKIVSKLAGVWHPQYKEKWKNILLAIYNYYIKIYCIIFIIMEIVFLLLLSKEEIRVLLKCLAWSWTHVTVCYKNYLWLKYGRNILNMIETLQGEQFHYENFDAVQIVKKNDKVNYSCIATHFWVGGLIPITACLGTIFSALTDQDSLNGYNINGEFVFCMNLPFPSWIPFTIDNSFKCALAGTMQSMAVLNFGFMIVSFDGMLTSMMSFISAHFLILQEAFTTVTERALHNLPAGKRTDNFKIEINYQINQEVNKCIRYLQTLLKMCEDLESIYKYQTLAQAIDTLLVFCVTLYLVSSISLTDKSFMSEISYMIAVAIELFLYCWFGNELTFASDDITQSIYNSDWISMDIKARRSLIITMIRMSKPVMLTLGTFSPLTLNTYLSILRASYSFFAVLKQVNE